MDLPKAKFNPFSQQTYLVAPILLAIFFFALLLLHKSTLSTQALADISASIIKEGTPFALMACGESLVVAAGSIDLSIVGTVALSGVAFATLTQLGINPLIASFFCACVGLTIGWLVGKLITLSRTPPLIVSWSIEIISMLAAVLFGACGIVRGTASSIPLGFLPAADFWSVLCPGFISAISVLIVTILVLNWSKFPLFCAAVGADHKAALYAGIDSTKIRQIAFTLNGLLCAIAGVFWALSTNSATNTDHIGQELTVVAIAVLGGTSLSGGYISLWSVVASALFWAAAKLLIDNLGLGLVGNLPSEVANGIFALILVAVIFIFGRNLLNYEGSLFFKQRSD